MPENTNPTILPENTAQTVQKLMQSIGPHEVIDNPDGAGTVYPHIVTIPKDRRVEDLTAIQRAAAEYFKPLRRKGTARMDHLQSLIDWANRFKGETSALFAKPDMTAPTLTCIADYHGAGAAAADGIDETASHCHHRAIYNFPLSDEWTAWMKITGAALDKDEMGEFIEANAKDIMDPTPPVLAMKDAPGNQPWETRLIATARQIEGRYGQLHQLLAMSKQFQVYETSNLTVSTNRDTGESEIQFLNEHRAKDGAALNIPNLIIIAIPVFRGGAPYRMPVRFRYRKMGGAVKFILSIYNPEKAFEAAFDEAVKKAVDETALPVFLGTPES